MITKTCLELAKKIPSGAKIAIFKDSSVPMTLGLNMIVSGIRDLDVVTVPTGGLLIDLLIGSGCVHSIETSGVSLGEAGPAPRFTEAVRNGSIEIKDSTCPAIYAGLQASEKGNPFMPLRGLLGSDILAYRGDIKEIDNPFCPQEKIVCLPAIRPDFAIFHAPLADQEGNIYVGARQELRLLAHASRYTLVTVEKISDRNLLSDPILAPGTISSFYITDIAVAQGGAKPLNLPEHYDMELQQIVRYAKLAKSEQGFSEWVTENISKNSNLA